MLTTIAPEDWRCVLQKRQAGATWAGTIHPVCAWPSVGGMEKLTGNYHQNTWDFTCKHEVTMGNICRGQQGKPGSCVTPSTVHCACPAEETSHFFLEPLWSWARAVSHGFSWGLLYGAVSKWWVRCSLRMKPRRTMWHSWIRGGTVIHPTAFGRLGSYSSSAKWWPCRDMWKQSLRSMWHSALGQGPVRRSSFCRLHSYSATAQWWLGYCVWKLWFRPRAVWDSSFGWGSVIPAGFSRSPACSASLERWPSHLLWKEQLRTMQHSSSAWGWGLSPGFCWASHSASPQWWLCAILWKHLWHPMTNSTGFLLWKMV